jgi:hypothetical protein
VLPVATKANTPSEKVPLAKIEDIEAGKAYLTPGELIFGNKKDDKSPK